MSGRAQVVIYGACIILVYALAIAPHLLEYGWAWGWPGAWLNFPNSLLSLVITVVDGILSLVLVLVLFMRPRAALLLRILAVPLILVGPPVVFGLFGGLATSVGRGLAARVSKVTPIDSLQKWAVARQNGSAAEALPPEVARTLPPRPRIEYRGDHVAVAWYDRGLLVGTPEFRPRQASFFEAEVRPGVYVYVVEH